jgi:rod shape-determining protein MreC
MKNKWFKNRQISTWAVIFGLLVFFHWTGLSLPIENLIIGIVSPLAVKLHNVSSNISSYYSEATDRRSLDDILKKQEADIAEITKDNARLHVAEEENITLRQYLKFFTENKYQYLMANVVSREVASFSPSERNKLIINKGLNDGVREGLVVVNDLGLVVGRITKVKDNLAEVSLLIDKGCRLAVSIQGDEGVAGVAQGESGLTIKVDFIPQTKVINQGQLVVTAGLENDVPGGLVIGKVSQLDKASNELWQQAVVEASADLDNLKIVAVIIPPATNW